ncbi:hypothetical protein LCGC14_1188100 [marine sediment metagenome]|uniref:Uncharacterized protein n=1 Tax=marine sediment metagenome TaxID=412755 RepID=A0A0F9LK81_9ZZZZ
MVAETETRKKSDELLRIAAEMVLLLNENHCLTDAEIGIVVFLMGDCVHYASEAKHIRKIMKK